MGYLTVLSVQVRFLSNAIWTAFISHYNEEFYIYFDNEQVSFKVTSECQK